MLPLCIVAPPELLVIVDVSELPPPQPASVTAIAVAIAAHAAYLGIVGFMSLSPVDIP
jgi:hypothetical protein